MDTTVLSQQGNYDIQCFRLQTARRKKRMQQEDVEKKLLQLYREREQLYQQQRNLGWMDLHPPYQRGWKRYFILREDVARSKHASFFEGILKKINTYHFSWRKDFKEKKRRMGKRTYVVKGQHLLEHFEHHFKKLNFSDREKQFFEERYVKEKWMKTPQKKYVFVEPWRFVLRVRPNMITQVRARDEAIERRIKEINSYLDQRNLNGKLSRLLGGGWYWRDYGMKPKEKNELKHKSIEQILDEYYYATL